jgi:hypothetical protein
VSTHPWTDSRLRGLALGAFWTSVLLFLATDVVHVLIAVEQHRSLLFTDGELGVLPFSLVIFTFPAVGVLLTRRDPTNAVGWLLLGVGLCWAVRGFWFDGYLRWAVEVHPGSLPGAGVVGALTFPLWIPMVGLIGTFLILLFPDGALPSPRWRPLGRACAVVMLGLYVMSVVRPGPVQQAPVSDLRNPFALDALAPATPMLDTAVLLLPLCILGCASALVVRFRRSRGVERLQLKWLATAGAFFASGYLVLMGSGAWAALTDAGPPPQWFDVAVDLYFLSFALIPLAIGVAVSRHGLYEIDRLLSRTVGYAVVTGLLVATYAGLVTGVSRLTPSSSSLAVAGSTLAVAALFQPLRRRVQHTVDRRFNRARFDAEATVEEFSRRLRSEVDLEAVCDDLLGVVRHTVEPAAAGVWLRPRDGRTT